MPGVPINIQQLGGAQPGYNPGIPQNNIQGIPVGSQQVVQQPGFPQPGFQQQSIPFGLQQNGVPIQQIGYQNPIGNTIQQPGYPINQQYIPQTSQFGSVSGPGPIIFPQ